MWPAERCQRLASMERLGFLSALIAVERNGKYVVIDGQHRFQAGTELGMKEFPLIVVPETTARLQVCMGPEGDGGGGRRARTHVCSADSATSPLVASGWSHGGTADLAGGCRLPVDGGDP